MRLQRGRMQKDPYHQFDAWYREYREVATHDPTSMILATADAGGKPSTRVVLLKGYSPEGFLFYSNLGSRKGNDLAANPRAALLFHWPEKERQIRVSGPVSDLDREQVLEYFHSRPRGSQLAAAISKQSRPVPSLHQLVEEHHHMRSKLEGQEVPLPDDWGGWLLKPEEVEFWQAGADRLHDRILYTPEGAGWKLDRLYP